MNRSAANLAAMHVKTTREAVPPAELDRCLTLFALVVEKIAKFLLSPEMIVQFTAVIVLRAREDKSFQHPSGCFFCAK